MTENGQGRKPDFFIVGAAKSGTTSLYAYLQEHPEVHMCEPKEPWFFGEEQDRHPLKQFRTIAEYMKLFKGAPDNHRAGEASPSYLCSKLAAQQIASFQPDAKIVIILRNPVDRAYSHYCHQRRRGREKLSFEEALAAEEERVADNWRFSFHYVRCGMYHDQVQRYFNLFGERSVRVYLFEDLVQNPDELCRDLLTFLELDVNCKINVGQVHNRGGTTRNMLGRTAYSFYQPAAVKTVIQAVLPKRWRGQLRGWVDKNTVSGRVAPMALDTRSALQEIFREDVFRLQSLIGRKTTNWMEVKEETSLLP